MTYRLRHGIWRRGMIAGAPRRRGGSKRSPGPEVEQTVGSTCSPVKPMGPVAAEPNLRLPPDEGLVRRRYLAEERLTLLPGTGAAAHEAVEQRPAA
jgi:hypothetical protein